METVAPEIEDDDASFAGAPFTETEQEDEWMERLDRCTLLWVAPCAYANTVEFSQFSFYLKASHKFL